MTTRDKLQFARTPKWLRDLFEFEYCPECGGDAEDHIPCEGPFG